MFDEFRLKPTMSDMPPRSPEQNSTTTSPESIHVLTLNCWGLKFISKYRSERLSEIGKRLASYEPRLDIVGLQECWTYKDYASIRDSTKNILPYAKFYHSGIFGGGLAIFSRWPIEDSSMFRYPLNGRPTAFFRGDWYVGKGVACTKIRMPDNQVIEVFNTHLHAPYEAEPNDSYICHRTAQAWEIAKLMRNATERGSLVLGLGDFNMVPLSFAHVLIESRGAVKDVWRMVKPDSSIGASVDPPEKERRSRTGSKATPDVEESIHHHGHTCDSILNTWRWNKAHREALEKGRDREIGLGDPDPRAKRLDYIFFSGCDAGWSVSDVSVALTERHPTIRCSLSDHFAVRAVVKRTSPVPAIPTEVKVRGPLDNPDGDAAEQVVEMDEKDMDKTLSTAPTRFKIESSFYEEILAMIDKYNLRERRQRRYRMVHFVAAATISIGTFVAIWWSPRNYVAFLLLILSTFGIMAGTIDGLIGGLFVGSELRALAEFEWEVRNAWRLSGGPIHEERPVRDWYD
jgi:sphingomyelin phosphodiesterase 2